MSKELLNVDSHTFQSIGNYLERMFKISLLSCSCIEKRVEDVQYYKGNLLLPVLLDEKYVPPPQDVVDLLFGVGNLVLSLLVCNHQPVNVEHNRLFLVDLNALKSKSDIKCDDSGCWINNSWNKFQFVKYEDNWTQCGHVDKMITVDKK
jgi:hypothetical protein